MENITILKHSLVFVPVRRKLTILYVLLQDDVPVVLSFRFMMLAVEGVRNPVLREPLLTIR
jgi:hypothetical protein